jgi:hypothetical protein
MAPGAPTDHSRSDIFLPASRAQQHGNGVGNGATGGMNYNRRSTRPDSLFYRETRKMRSPAGRGSRRIHPVALALLALALATFIWWFFKKP